jgi:dihydropteroate synthase
VTPDSFSDGGQHFGFDDAVRAALHMVDQGADLIDVGGESTRPGAEEVPVDEELRRTIPVLRELAKWGVATSIDTHKPEVARAALEEGAGVVNDVYGFREPALIEACRPFECTLCIMHMQGTPSTMQKNPTYEEVVVEVRDWLLGQAKACENAGIAKERIWIDPGIGFGKTLEHNLQILRNLSEFVSSGYPVMIGVSRKSFIGRIIGGIEAPAPVQDRVEGSVAAQVLAQASGARIIRAHDVRAARRAIDVAAKIQNPQS